jgi:CRP/FNR family cyclic AMP-dependent transcriptional regulator
MAFKSRREIAEPLQQSQWFMRQPAALRDALVERGRVLELAEGQWLHSQGDPSGGVWAVLSGSVRLEVAMGAERTLLVNIIGPGNVLGEPSSFGGGPRLTTVRASEKSFVFLVTDAALQLIAQAHPIIWHSINDLLYRQLERTGQMMAEALCLPPAARIAARLIAVAGERRPDCDTARITQADLAEMTGLARKSVNGHLLRLQKANIVRLAYREVRILNQPRLRALIDQTLN